MCKPGNVRNVRESSSANGGKPEILFNLPETIGFSKQGSQVDADTIRTVEETIGIDHHICLDKQKPAWIIEMLPAHLQIKYADKRRRRVGALCNTFGDSWKWQFCSVNWLWKSSFFPNKYLYIFRHFSDFLKIAHY